MEKESFKYWILNTEYWTDWTNFLDFPSTRVFLVGESHRSDCREFQVFLNQCSLDYITFMKLNRDFAIKFRFLKYVVLNKLPRRKLVNHWNKHSIYKHRKLQTLKHWKHCHHCKHWNKHSIHNAYNSWIYTFGSNIQFWMP